MSSNLKNYSSIQEIFKPVEKPKTALGYRRILSPTCGLRVSPLCLGGMSLGETWQGVTGKISKEEGFALLDAFFEAGGNFIDTANLYHSGTSEEWIGEWMQSRGNRDQIVLATKYTGFNDGDRHDPNSAGNHFKSMSLTVRDSLKRLRTDYIDILYIHFWEWTTSVEEVMRGFHRFILNGQVLYPAVSDTPAWIVAKANMFARQHGMSPFVLYQGRYNVGDRDMEREIIPMCRAEGMGICPWGTIGQGKWQSKAARAEREKNNEKLRGEATEKDLRISDILEKIGNEHNASVTAVATAWAMQVTPYVIPMLGGRKIEHLKDNIRAIEITLTKENLEELEKAANFEPGFPINMVGHDPAWRGGPGSVNLPATAQFQWVKNMIPIAGSEEGEKTK